MPPTPTGKDVKISVAAIHKIWPSRFAGLALSRPQHGGCTIAQARACGVPLNYVTRALDEMARSDADIARRLRLWGADCAARMGRRYNRGSAIRAAQRAAAVAIYEIMRVPALLVALTAAVAPVQAALLVIPLVAGSALAWALERSWQYRRLAQCMSAGEAKGQPLVPFHKGPLP